MLLLLIGTVLGLGAVIFEYSQEKQENKELRFDKDWIIFAIVVAIAIGTLTNLVGFIFTYDSYSYDKDVVVDTTISETREIIALQDKDAEEGKYLGVGVLGTGVSSGSNGTKTYYCWYEKTEYGYKYNKISPEDTNVYIDYCQDDETPTIQKQYDVITRYTILKKKPNLWKSNIFSYLKYQKYNVGDVLAEEDDTKTFIGDDYRSSRTVIYVPEGSIQENYTIDME